MKKKRIVLTVPCLLVVMLATRSWALTATLVGDTVVDSGGLVLSGGSWGDTINGVAFQQDGVASHNGWQYVAYYNLDRHVCVGRRQLPGGVWERLELTDYYFGSNDAHNIVSLGICPNDGTLHLSFDHHGSALHYRVSQTGVATNPGGVTWGAALFGAVRNYLEVGKSVSGVTYPRFWKTPSGDLQMCYRVGGSGDGDVMLVDYEASSGTWKDTRMVISREGDYSDVCGTGTSRNGYLNYPFYSTDGRLHWTWVWRESSQGTNHDICYAWSEDGGYTWYGNSPEQRLEVGVVSPGPEHLMGLSWSETGALRVADFATGQKITVSSPDTVVVPISRYYALMNQQSQAVDPQGRVHTVMYYDTDGAGCDVWSGTHYHHYWRDAGGVWQHRQLSVSLGSRPKLFIRGNGDAFLVYVRGGDVYVAGATAASQWTNWQVIGSVTAYSVAGEGLGDVYRIVDGDGILSVLAQEGNNLRILDFQLN